jgi:hypothetical protein
MFQSLHLDKLFKTKVHLRDKSWNPNPKKGKNTKKGKNKKGKYERGKMAKNHGLGIDWGVRKNHRLVQPKHYNLPIFDADYCAHAKLCHLMQNAPTRPARVGELVYDLDPLELEKNARSSDDPDAHSLKFR